MDAKWDELKRLAEAAEQNCDASVNPRDRATSRILYLYPFQEKASPAAVLELIAEVEQLTQRMGLQHETNRTLHSNLEQAQRECEELRKDAERYRTLRKMSWFDGDLAVVRRPVQSVKPGTDCPSHERLDAALDAAIAKEGSSNG